jgi:hypothetical protein
MIRPKVHKVLKRKKVLFSATAHNDVTQNLVEFFCNYASYGTG